MKTHHTIHRLFLGGLFLGALLLCMAPAASDAQMQAVDVEGMGYNVDASLADNLKALSGKKVGVTLKSGNTFIGTVGKVSAGFLHLEQLEGKEFFDALIRLEDISALDARFRVPKR